MSEANAEPYTRYQAHNRRARLRIALPGIVVGAVVLYGGYVEHWKWTGINRHTASMWDWLHLLLLPFVLAFLPIWMSRTTRLTPAKKRWSAAALGVFAVIVVFGYVIPWAWTGFVGNTLWDWLGLIALPLAVALAPLYGELRRTWSARHTLIVASVLAAFAVAIIGGYLADWRWTGFHNNTVWDWLHLLLLPLLIPLVVVPALKPMWMAGVSVVGPAPAATPERGERKPGAPGSGATQAGGAPLGDDPEGDAERAGVGVERS